MEKALDGDEDRSGSADDMPPQLDKERSPSAPRSVPKIVPKMKIAEISRSQW